MKTAGIIAEYNPFHEGHKYQINYLREQENTDYVIVAMSGDFVQRGTPALFSKYDRARMALLEGADLVLELPAALATASAELFARGGVQLLDGLGVVNTLCFGSEWGDAKLLMELAHFLAEEPLPFRKALQENLKEGMTFPKARALALCGLFPDNEEISRILASPNNILGIEYCKALIREHSQIPPFALKRQGSSYHETSLLEQQLPSASAIRQSVFQEKGKMQAASFLPSGARAVFLDALQRNACLSENDLDIIFRYCLLCETEESLCTYADMSEALAKRVLSCRCEFEGFSQFVQLLKTKNITQTRVQRALLHMLLHIKSVPETVPYARVLGFRRAGAPLLGMIKRQGRLPLITRLSDAASLLPDQAMAILDETTFASNLYENLIAQKKNAACIHEYRQQIVIV